MQIVNQPAALRAYPRDSAEAAARIVALALVANGRIKAVEAAVLDAADLHARLGMDRQAWCEVVRALHQDLRAGGGVQGVLSHAVLPRVLDDVQDRYLQQTVASLCQAVIHADRHVHPGEQALLDALQRCWDVRLPAVPGPVRSPRLSRWRPAMRGQERAASLPARMPRPLPDARSVPCAS